MIKVRMYKGFERLWHWGQALLILTLAITGFEVHDTWRVFGYRTAVTIHNTAAWGLIGLTAFSIFWHLTTGMWKQYIPRLGGLPAMARFYARGIFQGEAPPFDKRPEHKLNPFQQVNYGLVLVVLIPLQILFGLLYMNYNRWEAWGLGRLSLGAVATVHTVLAFGFLIYLVAHLYFITTGQTVLGYLKAMITGYEAVHD